MALQDKIIGNNQLKYFLDKISLLLNKKANQNELDTHTGNGTIHVTATDKTNLSTALSHSQSAHAIVDATKVESSSTNGNIKVNGIETKVYEHELSGATAGTYRQVTVDTKGHVTGGSNPTLPITQGGTGATTAVQALKNLGVTATASELNKLDGVTATTQELNYVDGTTSNIQIQLNGKAPTNHGNHIPNIDTTTNGKFVMSNGTETEWHNLTKNDVVDALGYTPGTGSNIVTAVKGGAEAEYKTGNVNITPASIGLGNVNNTKDSEKSVLSAGKLATARKIGNASFNGTSNITLAQIGAAPATGSSSIKTIGQNITLGNGGGATIEQNNGAYRQRIEISDNTTEGDKVFVFSQSVDNGVNYNNLMEIWDSGNVIANTFTVDNKILFNPGGSLYYNNDYDTHILDGNLSVSDMLETTDINADNFLIGVGGLRVNGDGGLTYINVNSPLLFDNGATDELDRAKTIIECGNVDTRCGLIGTVKTNEIHAGALYGENGLVSDPIYVESPFIVTQDLTVSGTINGLKHLVVDSLPADAAQHPDTIYYCKS